MTQEFICPTEIFCLLEILKWEGGHTSN
ncbi:uncharacterized protein METZ01_LOCUS426765, partial [marine metagenome]